MGEDIIDHCRPLSFVILEPRGLGNRVNICGHVTGKTLFCVSHEYQVKFSLFTP
jgi:hypothetical protein